MKKLAGKSYTKTSCFSFIMLFSTVLQDVIKWLLDKKDKDEK